MPKVVLDFVNKSEYMLLWYAWATWDMHPQAITARFYAEHGSL